MRLRTSTPNHPRDVQYDLWIVTKDGKKVVDVWRYANEIRQVKSQHRCGWETERRYIGTRLDPIPLSDFLEKPFEILPVEREHQRKEIIEWLRKEGYEPQTV